jgi:hypothetical protein
MLSVDDALDKALSEDSGSRFVTVDKLFLTKPRDWPWIKMYYDRDRQPIGFREGHMEHVRIDGRDYFTDSIFYGHDYESLFADDEQLDLLTDVYCALPLPFLKGDLIEFETIYCDDIRYFDSVIGENRVIGVFDSVEIPPPSGTTEDRFRMGLRSMKVNFWHIQSGILVLDYDVPYGNFRRYRGELTPECLSLKKFGDYISGRLKIDTFLHDFQIDLIKRFQN